MTDDRAERARRLAEDVAAGAPDRAGTFEERLRQVSAARAHRMARGRRLRLVARALTLLLGGALGAWLLPTVLPIDRTAAALLGLALAIGVLALAHAGGVLARRRGARAWDWRAERHRLLSDPAREVQRRDEPDEDPGPARDPRTTR